METKLYFNHDLEINNAFMVDLKNILSYMDYMKTRDLTDLEEEELQECLDGLRKGGFSNVVEALGF